MTPRPSIGIPGEKERFLVIYNSHDNRHNYFLDIAHVGNADETAEYVINNIVTGNRHDGDVMYLIPHGQYHEYKIKGLASLFRRDYDGPGYAEAFLKVGGD